MSDAPDVAIISAGHDVADARIHKIVASMIARGLRVEVFGLGDVTTGPPSAHNRTASRGSMLSRAMRALCLPWRTAARVLFTIDPDVVIPALTVGRVRGRKVVVDVHEDYAKLLEDRPWARGLAGWFARVLTDAASRAAARADLTVVTDDQIPPIAAHRRMVVRNLPAPGLLPDPVAADPQPRAIYIGDLRRSRGVFDMVDAVAAAPNWELDLVGPVASVDQAALAERLSRPDVAERVRCHGRLPPDRAWKLARGAWVGLLLLHDTPAFREAVPTKLYEYLSSGLAVITTGLPRQSAIVESSGAGVIVGGSADAARVLQQWASDPAAVSTYRGAALEWSRRELRDHDPYGQLADAVADLASKSRNR